jgi:hypothetical protein
LKVDRSERNPCLEKWLKLNQNERRWWNSLFTPRNLETSLWNLLSHISSDKDSRQKFSVVQDSDDWSSLKREFEKFLYRKKCWLTYLQVELWKIFLNIMGAAPSVEEPSIEIDDSKWTFVSATNNYDMMFRFRRTLKITWE